MVVLFDFDEVFVDLNTGALKYINEKLGTNYTNDDVKSWEFFDNPEVRKPFFDYLSLPDVYQKHVIPNKKMIKVLEQMVEMGKEVYIVTASVESSQESKYKFIKENMPFFDTSRLFTVNSSSKYKMKSDVLDELNLNYREPTVLVDDGIHNILDMMADINHKEKLDNLMKQFYISRTIKKYNNPYHDFIYGIVPELTYNKDIIDGKRIFKLKETKEIWGLLKNIDETHKLRVETKQAEVFNYLNNIINELLPADEFKEANELQNNVSYLAKSLLNGKTKNSDFVSDIGRFIVKFRKVNEHKNHEEIKSTISEIFKATDKKYGNDAMYVEIKSMVLMSCEPELFPDYIQNGMDVCDKYGISYKNNRPSENTLNEIIDIANYNLTISKRVTSSLSNENITEHLTNLFHKTGLAYEINFDDKAEINANINLALNKNYTFNTENGKITQKDIEVVEIKAALIDNLATKKRKP